MIRLDTGATGDPMTQFDDAKGQSVPTQFLRQPGGQALKVGFDLRHITRGASGGITPLIAETVKALHGLAPDMHLHVFGTMFNRDVIDITASNVVHHTLPLHGYYATLQALLDAETIDVLFRAFPNDDELTFPLSRQIVLIPDLQHEFYPAFFSETELDNRRRNFVRLISGCGAVATISEHAESTIRERYANGDIFLMSPSSQIRDALSEDVNDAFRAKVAALRPFFYFPANLWPHKNHAALLEAFRIFRAMRPDHARYGLVLTGHPSGWDAMTRAHETEGVTHIGFVSKAELVHLYQNAEALTFTSLFEGFGMPVLEAFGVGCPVICSDTTSLPEVAGGAALLCDPTKPEAIAARMADLAGNPALRAELIAKGNDRFGAYSWTSAAENLRQALVRVATQERPAARAAAAAPMAAAPVAAKANQAPSAAPAPAPAPNPARARADGPLVSIVTPSYNQGRFLRRTIESVLNQTYPNIEFVVMDGGSTDESVEILQSYGDRFRWVSEPDKGQTNAINKGLATCSGTIQAYLNSDDTLEPDAVEKVVEFFEAHPDVDMIYGLADYIDPDDAYIGEYATADYSFDRLVDDCCVCQPAAFWRARVPATIGPFDESLNYTMDYDYWLRIGAQGLGVRHLPVKLAHSRLYAETKTMSARGKIYAEIFEISLRHANRVSRSYVQGFWSHRLHERDDLFARVARRIPMLDRVFVEYDSYRLAAPGRTRAKALTHIARRAARSARKRLKVRVQRAPALAALTSGVAGVFADNWLAPQVLMSASTARARPLVIEGVAPKGMRARVESEGTLLADETIPAGAVTRIAFHGTGGPIKVTFDDHIVDEARRKLSFHVLYTNCFAEHEI